jgi:uncharacterized protein with von Willebrand factor type A (vWA) domain
MTTEAESRIADNVLLFCRTLRTAGLPIGPGQVIEAGAAILATGIERRDDFYHALRAVLVKDPSELRVFDQAFHIWFRNPRLLERMMGLLLPTLEQVGEEGDSGAEPAVRRLLEALSESREQASEEVVVEIDHAGSWSSREVLREKDFEQMSLEEQREAAVMLRESGQFLREVRMRRFRSDRFGSAYDLRRTFRLMLRNNGQLIQLARKSRRMKPPALVLLCDISGSMSRYSRMFMHFAHALSSFGQPVHTFVFGTRLTNITHWLADRDVDKALARVSDEVPDWDGGTRIADCLERFNMDWGRRVLTGHAVVLLLSDGLERDSGADLGFQAARLRRSSDELIWLNPMLRFERFEPRATGMRALLPHADRFLPAHNVASLSELGRLLCGDESRNGRRAA